MPPATAPGAPAAAGRPATIYDVARAAGVSHQTVSRFLQGYQGIRPQTRDKVVRALEQLDYRPNLTARSLTTGRSHRLGALTHEIDQVGPSKIVQGASLAAREAGYLLDIVTLDMTDRAAIGEAIELVTRHDLAGVLALASTDEMTRAFASTRFRVPAVVGAEADDDPGHGSSQLTAVGFPALLAHLAGLGHRDVVHISGPGTWAAARNRSRAYQAAVTQHGLRSAGILAGDWSAASGYRAARLLDRDSPVTAVVAANDQMALGAILALQERGFRIPEDISVTGVDDIPDAAYFSPPLTTLRVDFAAQGRAAVHELLAVVEGHPGGPAPGLVSELVVRKSTGPAPAGPR